MKATTKACLFKLAIYWSYISLEYPIKLSFLNCNILYQCEISGKHVI